MAAPHSSPDDAIAAAKRAMRADMRARLRGRIAAANQDAAGEMLAAAALGAFHFAAGTAVAGVWPLPGEIDLRPLLHGLHARGCRLLLPETPPPGNPLLFRAWRPGEALRPGRYGTQVPSGAPGVPDVIFVPLLAFDRQLCRLGQGGGFYDRTLHAYPAALALGFGFAMQEVDKVPCAAHDRPLAAIITERGAILPHVAAG